MQCECMIPSIDEVFGQADAGWGASDGDLAVAGALDRIGNLDLSSWHLANLIYLGTLTANNAANQLQRERFKNPHLSASGLGSNVIRYCHTDTTLTSFGMVSSWELVCVVASMPAVTGQGYSIKNRRNKNTRLQTTVWVNQAPSQNYWLACSGYND